MRGAEGIPFPASEAQPPAAAPALFLALPRGSFLERPAGGGGRAGRVAARSAPQWGGPSPQPFPPRTPPGARAARVEIGRRREGPAAAAAAPVGGQPGDLLEGDPG